MSSFLFLQNKMTEYLMQTYRRLPLSFTKGRGVWLYDTEEKKYLDAISGIGVCGLGHAFPSVTQAIQEQAAKYLHCSNLFHIQQQEALAEVLIEKTGLDKVFFCNSGTEAIEAALKISRLFARTKNIHRPKVISMTGSFHGRTFGALSATGNATCQQGFEPLLDGFIQVPFNDLASIQALAINPQTKKEIVAILVEPIQGEGGVNIPDDGYLTALRETCNANNWLLILDEIQTGLCRTGRWFACQHEKVSPDVLVVAKALGNGVPIGACIAGKKAANLLQPGNHGTTFGGNPLACSAGLATLSSMQALDCCKQAEEIGAYILEEIQFRLASSPYVKNVRGRGLMIGIELDRPCDELVEKALALGLLINVTAKKVIRLLPPLILNKGEAKQLIDNIVCLIENFREN